MDAIERHVGKGLFCLVLANRELVQSPDHPETEMVPLQYPADSSYEVLTADLVDQGTPWRHDSRKLASQILAIYHNHPA
jgi:hypothetical protein